LILIGHTVKHIYISALSVILLPNIKQSLNLSSTTYGSLSLAGRITGTITTFFSGFLGDKYARRSGTLLGISLLITGISYLFLSYSDTIFLLTISMLITGIGPSMYHAPALATLAKKFPEKQAFALSLHGTGGSLGETLGPLIFGSFLIATLAVGWEQAMRVSSIIPILIGVIGGFGINYFLRNDISKKVSLTNYYSGLQIIFTNKPLLILITAAAIRGMGESALEAFLPVFFLENWKYSVNRIAIYKSLMRASGTITQPLLGIFTDKYSPLTLLIPSLLFLGLLCLTIPFSNDITIFSIPLIPITLLVMGIFEFSLQTIFVSLGLDLTKINKKESEDMKSTIVALMWGAMSLGLVSPVIGGIIADTIGMNYTIIYSGILILISALALIFLKLNISKQV
jgi:MFS family permease